jgi:acyl-coenzyme A thioesterase PaaI-like protein
VLYGLAANRTPGFHFTGNFLQPSFDRISQKDVRVSVDVGAHCAEADGQMNHGAIALIADIAAAAYVRAGESVSTRLATVHLALQFTGEALTGRLEVAAAQESYIAHTTGRQGTGKVHVTAHGKPACFGIASFMVLNPPKGVQLSPMPHRTRDDPLIALPAERELSREELKVLRHAEASLAHVGVHGGSFIRRFWGYEPHAIVGGAACALKNGPHVGNRVGHVQGGVLVGLGAATASAALPASWMLAGVSAWFISPGQGRVIKAKSKIIHHGRLTSVVRTQINGKNNRRVMELVTHHAHCSQHAL